MWDTGACYNILTRDLATRLGLFIDKGKELPLLELTDGSITSPIGTTSTTVRFNPDLSMKVQFFVFEGAPNEAILGSDFMEQTVADVSFGNKTISMNATEEERTTFSFKPTLAARVCPAAAMHACDTITVPANSEMTVPVRFAYPRGNTPSQVEWGLIKDSNCKLHTCTCKVAKGITAR
jgi:hypothetical protein